jgi:hypothetical protein
MLACLTTPQKEQTLAAPQTDGPLVTFLSTFHSSSTDEPFIISLSTDAVNVLVSGVKGPSQVRPKTLPSGRKEGCLPAGAADAGLGHRWFLDQISHAFGCGLCPF